MRVTDWKSMVAGATCSVAAGLSLNRREASVLASQHVPIMWYTCVVHVCEKRTCGAYVVVWAYILGYVFFNHVYYCVYLCVDCG